MKDKIKYHTACAYNLATDLDSIFDWIATTAPKSKCYENVCYAYLEL